MTRTEKLLRELIALPSVNPAFLPPGDLRAGERRIAEFLSAVAARAGLDIEFQPVSADRANVIARLSPSGKISRRILLAPHLDTVNAASLKQFVPARKDTRLYGRGACDTKGSVAAMLMAVCELANHRARPKQTEIVFAGLVDEENLQQGSRRLVSSGFKADLAIVGEPTRLKVVTAHKGSLWLQLTTRGKAAHGARPELGVNAVHKMARMVDALETKYAAQLRRRKHPLLGRATINVGKISGGSQPNIVPAECVIEIDRRTLPGETEASVRRELNAISRGARVSFSLDTTKPSDCQALETNFKLPLIQQFFHCARQTKPLGVDFFCDASVLSQSGIPSVVFGPGDIAQAHTADEWISVRELERARDLLVRFFTSLP